MFLGHNYLGNCLDQLLNKQNCYLSWYFICPRTPVRIITELLRAWQTEEAWEPCTSETEI